jgi:hypothetical protein
MLGLLFLGLGAKWLYTYFDVDNLHCNILTFNIPIELRQNNSLPDSRKLTLEC